MKEHWETVYQSKRATELSWYQPEPRVSLELIARVAPEASSTLLDVGGGASTLVDGLIARGYRNCVVLDIAANSLETAQARLGPTAAKVSWIVADVLAHPFPPHQVDVWHDRAVFHFLTRAEDRRKYVAQVERALRPGGHVIVATFAGDGPTRCSGLEVCRYGPRQLRSEFGAAFQLVAQQREAHVTPSGARQRFQYCLCTYHPAQSQAA